MTAHPPPEETIRDCPTEAASGGCTSCGSQRTTTLDGIHGRRCADCQPAYDRSHALGLVTVGWVETAWAYLGTALAYGRLP